MTPCNVPRKVYHFSLVWICTDCTHHTIYENRVTFDNLYFCFIGYFQEFEYLFSEFDSIWYYRCIFSSQFLYYIVNNISQSLVWHHSHIQGKPYYVYVGQWGIAITMNSPVSIPTCDSYMLSKSSHSRTLNIYVQLQLIFRTNIISLLDSSKGFSISACRRFERDK